MTYLPETLSPEISGNERKETTLHWFLARTFVCNTVCGAFQGIIQKIVDSHKVKHVACYGFRLSHLRSEEVHWLHLDMGVSSVREKYELAHPPEEWK